MVQAGLLSEREQEVLTQLLEGKSNKMIALTLHISASTVEFHLKNIYTKFQVSSRTELILKLRKSTVADLEDFTENKHSFYFRQWIASIHKLIEKFIKERMMKSTAGLNPDSGKIDKTFFESILTGFTKYADFQGQASRSEFWWFFLFILLVASALTLIDQVVGEIFLILTLLPLLSVGARRLHDIGKNAWWLLYLLVPIGGLVILGILWAQPTINPKEE